MTTVHLLPLMTTPALLAAAMMDIISRQVPNWIAVCALSFGLAARWLSGDLLQSALLAFAVFCVLFAVWQRGWFGGADAKLLAACTLLVPASATADLLLAVAIAGGILSLIYLAGRHVPKPAFGHSFRTSATSARRRVARLYHVELWRMRRAAPIPYVCAIAAGCIVTLITG